MELLEEMKEVTLQDKIKDAEAALAELTSKAEVCWASIGKTNHQTEVLKERVTEALPEDLQGAFQQLEFYHSQVSKTKKELAGLEQKAQQAHAKLQSLKSKVVKED
jgi:chromosome segregation ATPase